MKLALAIATSVLLGCANLIHGADHLTRRNQEGLQKLRVGMPLPEVLDAMASREYLIREVRTADRMRIGNPYRRSYVRLTDGRTATILYYYTQVEEHGDVVSSNELTPLLVRDDRLLGWGREFLDQNADPESRAQLVAREVKAEIAVERGAEMPQGDVEANDEAFREAVGRASYLMRIGTFGIF